MATTEERMQILNMIQEGKISAEEGARLLRALETKKAAAAPPPGGSSARWFRVRVTDLTTGRNKVNVNIPTGLVNVGLKMGARFIPETADIDVEDLIEQIRSGAQGKIMDITNEEESERVEIFVE